MVGWIALVYLGISVLFYRDSHYLEDNARVLWALAWPVLSLILAALLLYNVACRVIRRVRR